MAEAAIFRDVDDATIGDLLAEERAVVILTKSTCGACARYHQDIARLMDRGAFKGIAIGKLTLDRPGGARFKRDNPWVSEVSVVPYTVLYREGEPVNAFAASKASYLAEQIEDYLSERSLMLSDHQRRMRTKVFDLLDFDKDGFLEQSDFELIARNIADIRGWQGGSSEYGDIMAKYAAIWTVLYAPRDQNGDGKVSLDEYLAVAATDVGEVEEIQEHRGGIVAETARSLFDILDLDSNGVIGLEEYRTILKVFGIDEDVADEVFPRLDLNGDGHISRTEFAQLVQEYFAGDDRQAPGNWLFGLS